MFGISVRDYIKEDSYEGSFPLTVLVVFTVIAPLIFLVVCGVEAVDYEGVISHPYSKCLYIGLPILFGVWIPILLNIGYKTKYVLFKKSGFIWERCPYILWIIKGCVDLIISGYIILLACPIFIMLCITRLILGLSQIVWVICTTPDGKAEAKIKKIWE